jgi:ribosome maturation factor RimP
MEIKDKIRDLAIESLPGKEFFIVEVKVTGKANQQKVLVIADGDNGISIDDCAELSRKLGDALDASELLSGAFQLEVSSPGADEVIKDPRQYTKNTGRRLEIVNEDDELIIGTLEGVKENSIVIIPEVKKKKASGKDKKEEPVMLEIPYSKIKKSNVIISFK